MVLVSNSGRSSDCVACCCRPTNEDVALKKLQLSARLGLWIWNGNCMHTNMNTGARRNVSDKNTGAHFGKFSLEGGYRIAVRQRFTYGATASTLRMLDVNACDKVVNLWENRLGVNIRMQTCSWQQTHMEFFGEICTVLRNVSVATPDSRFESWTVLRVQCDGTNAPAAQQQKAQCLRLVMVHRHP